MAVEKVQDGVSEQLQEPTSFNVVRCIDPTLTENDPQGVQDYYKQVTDFQTVIFAARSRLQEAQSLLDEIESGLQGSAEAHSELRQELVALQKVGDDLNRRLNGSDLERRTGQDAVPSISQRAFNAGSTMFSLASPTQTHRDSFEIAREMYSEIQPELAKFAEQDVESLADRAREAGVDGISGGPVPVID